MDVPDIRYARSGDVSIAYTERGEGPLDVLFVHGFVGNRLAEAEVPHIAAFEQRLASFSRLIEFDRRGTGLSDRVREVPTLEARMDDVRAVLDAVASDRAVLLGTFEAGAMCVLFAATYPERTAGLALYNPIVRGTWAPDFPWAPTLEQWREDLEETGRRWGTDDYFDEFARWVAPTLADDDQYLQSQRRVLRLGASPGAVIAIKRMAMETDVRDVLPAIRVPTVVLHKSWHTEEAVYAASRIPGARRVELPGPDTLVTIQGEPLVSEVERLVREAAGRREPDTVLATVLFTDLVGSTAKTAELGDSGWRELLERHHAVVRRQLDRARGHELDTAGDGFFAAFFDGPIRAIRAAQAITVSIGELGLELRAGLHTGECERVGEKLGGLAVAIGARIAALAEPGEVLVSQTVKDLVAGSGLEFEERGEHELKGVPGTWRLYAVVDG
ncbi:MAG TPA: adenylate/guanylate cyclase domain-containing protein [Gaiellaceae bacterium]|jgi:class 3 adenylate cyclase|nr:adenylate/guanylate cyclase domain-containing protein [Gaiellaceae bacterium]